MSPQLTAHELLKNFVHGRRTDLDAKTMTNQDALAVLLLHCGQMTVREARTELMVWRFGGERYRVVRQVSWARRRSGNYKRKIREVNRPERHFTYLFNPGESKGYNFVAPDIAGARVMMYGVFSKTGEMYEWERRQLWYRACRGHYAITLEGVLRVRELGLTP